MRTNATVVKSVLGSDRYFRINSHKLLFYVDSVRYELI